MHVCVSISASLLMRMSSCANVHVYKLGIYVCAYVRVRVCGRGHVYVRQRIKMCARVDTDAACTREYA